MVPVDAVVIGPDPDPIVIGPDPDPIVIGAGPDPIVIVIGCGAAGTQTCFILSSMATRKPQQMQPPVQRQTADPKRHVVQPRVFSPVATI
mmetsp:Transcript_76660/g.201129  ORF Transcript_76660/g.201129 Transcript_76660/m.201129 type:complete len:90 (+) Transcript_76660:973-1242(+)